MKKGFSHINNSKPYGFTLAELLIALLILGVIATFTIPKVLQSQQNSQYKSAAKEVAGLYAEAFQQYKQQNAITASFSSADLIPFLNYVALDTSSTISINTCGGGSLSCGAFPQCLKMHSGGTLHVNSGTQFGSTNATNTVSANFDPDGSGPADGIQFYIYHNGRLRTRNTVEPNSANSAFGDIDPITSCDPSWFSWN